MFVNGSTHCVDCRFKEMDGITQIGCSLNVLEQYRKNGEKIIEAYNDEDGEKEFFVIENKICPWYRGKGWVGENKDDAEKEILGRMLDIVLFVDRDCNLTYVLDSVVAQTMSPATVHVLVKYPEKNPPKYYLDILSSYEGILKYNLHYITNNEMTDGDALNLIGDKCTSYYYAVFRPIFPLLDDFVEKIFIRSYRQMKPFILVKDGDDSGSIINTKAHRVFYGNDKKMTIQEKILEQAATQNLMNKIVTYEELYAKDN